MRGQDDRKRERQARDGVSRPAGEDRPAVRGFPGSWHLAKVRGQGGKALCPLGPPPSTAGGQIASVSKAEPDKQMAAISADRQSVIADKRRNGRNRSRTRTVARVEAEPDQPKDLLFRRLLTSKETYPALVAGFIIREQKFSGEQHE